MKSSKKEIEMLHKAIIQCNRDIVLSLSPGPALIEEAWHYERYANMWRITDDFWDNWQLLLNMFQRCEVWQNHVSEGCYPDCDMLPLGYLRKGFGKEEKTNFTKEEQVTMMTLWCIFRSPLMLGAEMTKLDKWTLSLLTNKDVLRLLKYSANARQVERDESHAIWIADDKGDGSKYIALFNFEEETRNFSIINDVIELDTVNKISIKELWSGERIIVDSKERLTIKIPRHGAKLFKCER